MSRGPTLAAPAAEKASGLHAVARSDTPAERQADQFATDQFASGGRSEAPAAAVGWSFGQVPVHDQHLDVSLEGDGRQLAPALQHGLGTGLGIDLSGVRLHTDASAEDTARRAGADAVTVGSDIAFAPGKYDPHSRDGRRRIAHEVNHVAQNAHTPRSRVALRQGKGAVTPATTLDGLPEADRKRLQVVTNTVIAAPADDALKTKYFDKGTTLGAPSDVTVAVDAAVPAVLAHGLTNLAGDWSTGADAVLIPNSTFTVELDLSKRGGSKAPFRFTFTLPPAKKGATQTGRIIVEQLGAATPPPGTTQPPEPKKGEAKPTDPIEAKLKAASITYSGYGAAEEEALRGAISKIPAAHLAAVSGLRFGRRGVDPTNAKVGGRYLEKEHKIVMYDNAFSESAVKFAEGGVATSYASRLIIHEIGHALDLRALGQAYVAKEAATKAVNDASGTFTSADEAKKYKDAVKAEKDAETVLKGARSRSGTTTREKPLPKGAKPDPARAKEYEDVIGTAHRGVPFREAVKRDGKDVSKYGEEDWQESYAEAYSLYLSSPTMLKAIRPATFDHLDKNLPK